MCRCTPSLRTPWCGKLDCLPPIVTSTKADILRSLERRKETCWQTAAMFLENKDSHGLHDMGVEIQALERAIAEVSMCTG